jgi:methylglutaconyl-CoA hydratase
MGNFETLIIHDEAQVRTIQMNRPERRNAINATMIAELRRALDQAAVDDCAVVILTGAGNAFCAGVDLDHLQRMHSATPDEKQEDTQRLADLLRALYDFPKPTIAAVNGAAIAGGTGLATICDFTLAVPAAKFGYTEVRIGFIPAIVASFLLLQVGEKKARDLLMTGRLIEADEACSLGLATKVVPDAELMTEARNLAQSLLQNSPQAMARVKRLLSAFTRASLDAEIAEAIEQNAEARQTPDFEEGIRAFLEKRKPVWPSLKSR